MNRSTVNMVPKHGDLICWQHFLCLPAEVLLYGSDYRRLSDSPDHEPAIVKPYSDLA